MQIGICARPEDVRPVEGLEYVEGGVADLLMPRAGESAFAERLAALKRSPLPVLAANVLFPGDIRLTGPEADEAVIDAYIATVCRRARRVGLRTIVFGSGGSRKVPDGLPLPRAREQLVGHMKRWAPVAEENGVTFVLEPLNRGETNIVNSVGEGAEMVRRVRHPNIRLLADTYHMAVENEPAVEITRAADLIAHAHCAEGKGRVPVGFGGEDHRPYFRALLDLGCPLISIEARWADFQAELPRAVAELKKQIETA